MAATASPQCARRVGKPLVDEATLNQWAETGARSITNKLAQALKATAESPSDAIIDPDSDLYRLFYELVWIVVHAKLTRHDVVSVLKDVDLASYPDASDTFLDIVWVIGNEVEASEKGRERHSSPAWQQLCRFVKAIADASVVPLLSLTASLEYDLLHQAGLVSEPQLMRKKILRINTKALYTQIKYNLLREESEGFAKVLALLHTGVSKSQLETTQTDLLALIGFFDLDANRVLDLVLDAYERDVLNDSFAVLLQAFKAASIPHVLGFKFQFYCAGGGAESETTTTKQTPATLYRLAATLIHKGLVAIDDLLPHLSPSRDAIVALDAARIQQLETQAQAFGKVNLAAKSDDKTVDAEDKVENEEDAADNQVFGLIVGLLAIHADAQAFALIAWFRKRNVDPLVFQPLTTQLCASIHALIAPLYAPLSLQQLQLVGTSSSTATAAIETTTPVTTTDALSTVVFPLIEMLGAHLHTDALLLTKLLRILTPLVEAADASSTFRKHIQTLVVQSFFPALSHQSSNPSIVFQLWDLVKLYPFDQRYRMYQQWLAAYAKSAELKLIDAQVVQSTRKIMRRLTADRAKPSARHLTHFCHANPLIVFRTMLRQIQSYDNLIQPVVESFKFVTPLGMDVLSFVLVSELAKSSQQSMKADGTNVSLWLTSLATFAGTFYRKYPNVELAGLLQYLIQRLQNWESVDLIVLSELLAKMGSCISFEDISLNQLEALAGGPHLGYEPADPKLMNRRAIPRLRDALVKRSLALPLCLLIGQMRSRIEHHESGPRTHLKLLGRVYDTCQMTLSQLLEFLNGVVDPSAYTAMLPSLTSLVTEFHLEPELAMTLCRPAMRFHDPILRLAPRSIHAATTTSTSTITDKSDATAASNWFVQSPALLADVATAVTSADGSNPFDGWTKELFVTFWTLVLYDLYVPFAQYETEIVRLRTSLTAAGGMNNPTLPAAERKKLKEKTLQLIDQLTTEQKDQIAHRKRVLERLEVSKTQFFTTTTQRDSRSAVFELLQRCVIPRALLSPEDALFSAKFMERLHAIDTPSFSTLSYYNAVNLKLPSIVLCVTEREAGNFGIFLKETVSLLHRWYQSAVAYEDEALHRKSGFSVDLHDATKKLPHRQYKLAYAKWHKWMAKVFGTTLASSEYMPMRNTLIVLTKLIDVFPASKSAAERLLVLVEKLTKEDREDIKIMAKRYFALLTKRKATLVDDKLLAVAAAATKKSMDNGAVEATAVDDTTAGGAIDAGKTTRSDSNNDSAKSSDRRASLSARQLRTDLESGEISSPPAALAAAETSTSTRRSNERLLSERERERERERGMRSSSSSGSRLQRRDVDRAAADESSNNNSNSRLIDEKRGRRDGREMRDGREAREPREASPGKPPLSSTSGISSRASSAAVNAPAAVDALPIAGRKRDRSRERSSRSADERRNGRDRSDAAAPVSASTTMSAAASSNDRDTKANSSATTHATRRPVEPLPPAKREPDDATNDSRKRQRVELSEAALRRQLTEQKDQVRRDHTDVPGSRSATMVTANSSTRGDRASRGSGPIGGDAAAPAPASRVERSERLGRTERPHVSTAPAAASPTTAAASTPRKIVSLVSSSRKRDDDDPTASAAAAMATAVVENNSDDRRRRDSGRGFGGRGNNNSNNNTNADGSTNNEQRQQQQQQQQRGQQQDDRKKLRFGRKSDSSGGNNANQQQQQQQSLQHPRDQSRSGGDDHDRRGGGGNGQGRNNDGGSGRGNADRGGGGGGGGRRRDSDRRGRR